MGQNDTCTDYMICKSHDRIAHNTICILGLENIFMAILSSGVRLAILKIEL